MPRYLPDELEQLVERQANQHGTVAFLTQRRHNRLREMWCAAKFSRGYERSFGGCQVDIELNDEQREFDFHLVLPTTAPLPFQVFEVLDAGRRRSAEFRDQGLPEGNSAPAPLRARSSLYPARRLHDELAKKVAKRYAGSRNLHLLAYLNLNAGSLPWASLASAAEFAAPSFASIWAVTHHLVTCLHGGTRWAGKIHWKAIESAA